MVIEVKRKIKLFQIIKQNFAKLGISSNLSTQNNLFNKNVLTASLFYGLNITLNGIFLFFKANTFREYTDSIYPTSAVITISVCFANTLFKMTKLFDFFERCDTIADERE